MIPSQPVNLIPRPFAAEGNFTVVPDTTVTTSGRASFSEGFPTETQRPLRQGGVAPNRLDFNGLFNMLSAFAFWQQSGGQFSYNAALNYTKPNIVFHHEKMWWCLKENGPDSAAGEKEPGTDEAYWQEYFQALYSMSGGLSLGNPVGTVITYWGTAAPEGYLPCDGSSFSASDYPELRNILGRAATPDLRGYFIRGYDTRNTVDPNGQARAIGSVQQDSGLRLSGRFGSEALVSGSTGAPNLTGPFSLQSDPGRAHIDTNIRAGNQLVVFDTNKAEAWGARSGTEFRGKNVCLLYCIKHD